MLINVMLGGKTKWLTNNAPCVEGGYPSQMDDSLLQKMELVTENENEKTVATEYWLDGELVHRSVHVHLKKPLELQGSIGKFN